MTKEPEWGRLPPATPPRIVELLKRCLKKGPRERLHDIADARLEIEDAIARGSVGVGAESLPSQARLVGATRSRSRERLVWPVLAGVLIAVIVAQWLLFRPSPSNQTPMRLSILPPPKSSFRGGNIPAWPVISPDGTRLALVVTGAEGQSSLWVRPIDSVTAQSIAGTEEASDPFWSPDGRSIGFFANGKLKTVGATGGAVRTLCDASFGGGTWNATASLCSVSTTRRV